MIQRKLESLIDDSLFKGKSIVLTGARQVGKTTLLKMIAERISESVLWLNGDDKTTRNTLDEPNLLELRLLIGNNKVVVIDEAQKVNNIGLTMKLIVDNFPDIQLLATGSSAFELRNRLNEPLTGRKIEYRLFPISTSELIDNKGLLFVKQSLTTRLVYGSYPDVITRHDDIKRTLIDLTDSYLYKDVLEVEGIRKSPSVEKLLIALALQVGSEVSYNELAKTVGIDSKTVEKYVDILEKCYIIFRLNSFSRNIRTEMTKGKKVYFWDNGVRNAVLQNFAPLEMRQDVGPLWENFLISERIKSNHYNERFVKSYFWRTTDQKEIDYVEECDGQLHLFEIKWNPKKKNICVPSIFAKSYNPNSFEVVTPDDYLQFVL